MALLAIGNVCEFCFLRCDDEEEQGESYSD